MSRLLADTYLDPGVPVVPSIPIPNSIPATWTPSTSTLIHSAHSAVLVDPLTTRNQSAALASWVAATIPGKKLKYIYITHGHGDHFFGFPGILREFPDAVPIATEKVLEHMRGQVGEVWPLWQEWFPGEQIERPDLGLVRTLDGGADEEGEGEYPSFKLDEFTLNAVPVGHGDTDDSTVLWSPDLKLVVAGDVVYNGGFQYIPESITLEGRQSWIDAVGKVRALGPTSVVTGHKRPGAVDGAWTLDWTQQYLKTWGENADLVRKDGGGAKEMFEKMKKAFPDNVGDFILWTSALAQFAEGK